MSIQTTGSESMEYMINRNGWFRDREMNYRFMYLDDDNTVIVAMCRKETGINLQSVFNGETNRKARGFLSGD